VPPTLGSASFSKSLLDTLRSLLGNDAVSTDEETLERLSFDAIDPRRLMTEAAAVESRVAVAVRPETTAQVSEVARLAAGSDVPVIPYGGGTCAA